MAGRVSENGDLRGQQIIVLTGAGISAESGLSTFRDPGGVWSRYDLNDVATPQGFHRNPELVHSFYNARRQRLREASPNAAHKALARLGKTARVTIVTQNVDDLHERADSAGVLHMHGELARALCGDCGFRWAAPDTLSTSVPCPRCGRCAARPDVVWFGEFPYHMERIELLLGTADLFVSIGTSGEVSPANGFVFMAAEAGAKTIELNLERTSISDAFDEVRQGPATQTVPEWVDEMLGRL